MERVLQIVGGGRMGEALLGGLIAAGRAPESLAVVEVFAARREQLASAYPGVTVAEAPVSAPDALSPSSRATSTPRWPQWPKRAPSGALSVARA